MKRSLTLCAVTTMIIGVSIPAAAIAGSNGSSFAAPGPTTTRPVETQSFASGYFDPPAPVIRDEFGVQTIKEEPALAFSVTGTLVQWPANTTVINDGFGYRDGGEFHGGVDIMAPGGSTIMAASPGTVVTVAEDDGWGAYVKVDHGGGIFTLYAHMVSGSQMVSVGQFVAAGDGLGIVGQTGYASVPHLHFEVYAGGSRVDPMGWLP